MNFQNFFHKLLKNENFDDCIQARTGTSVVPMDHERDGRDPIIRTCV